MMSLVVKSLLVVWALGLAAAAQGSLIDRLERLIVEPFDLVDGTTKVPTIPRTSVAFFMQNPRSEGEFATYKKVIKGVTKKLTAGDVVRVDVYGTDNKVLVRWLNVNESFAGFVDALEFDKDRDQGNYNIDAMKWLISDYNPKTTDTESRYIFNIQHSECKPGIFVFCSPTWMADIYKFDIRLEAVSIGQALLPKVLASTGVPEEEIVVVEDWKDLESDEAIEKLAGLIDGKKGARVTTTTTSTTTTITTTEPWPLTPCASPRDVAVVYEFSEYPKSLVTYDLIRALGRGLYLGPNDDNARLATFQSSWFLLRPTNTLSQSTGGIESLVANQWRLAFDSSAIAAPTEMPSAIRRAAQDMLNEDDGMREYTKKIPRVVVTISESMCPTTCATEGIRPRMDELNATVVSVGIGPKVTADFLLGLAGGLEDRVVYVEDPNDMSQFASKILDMICATEYREVPATTTLRPLWDTTKEDSATKTTQAKKTTAKSQDSSESGDLPILGQSTMGDEDPQKSHLGDNAAHSVMSVLSVILTVTVLTI